MGSLIERYRRGERDSVWHELRQLGAGARDPEHLAQATAVAREAMRRARANIEVLIERLRAQGFTFGDPFGQAAATLPFAGPDEHTPGFVAWVEQRMGPLALTARAWIEEVGDVSLQGRHPEWPATAVADPLMIEVEYKSWDDVSRDRSESRRLHEANREFWEDGGRTELLCLEVAPDALHKANVSGGAPCGFLVPDGSADAAFRCAEGVVLPFIEYLRLAFRHGGFPGLAHHELGRAGWAAKAELARGLLDL